MPLTSQVHTDSYHQDRVRDLHFEAETWNSQKSPENASFLLLWVTWISSPTGVYSQTANVFQREEVINDDKNKTTVRMTMPTHDDDKIV